MLDPIPKLHANAKLKCWVAPQLVISEAPRPAGTIAGASPRVLPVRSAAARGSRH